MRISSKQKVSGPVFEVHRSGMERQTEGRQRHVWWRHGYTWCAFASGQSIDLHWPQTLALNE